MSENTEVTFVPNNTLTVQIDPLSEAAFKVWYENWTKNQGAKIAAAAGLKEAAQKEIERLSKVWSEKTAEYDKMAVKLAKDKNWAGIALNEANRETALKEHNKLVAKQQAVLDGKKATGEGKAGTGEMTVAKLDWAQIRSSVHYFGLDGKAYIVTHSSVTKGKQTESDVFYAMECQPVSVKHEDSGLAYTESIPTITGAKMARLEVKPGKQSVLSHSGFCNGVKEALRAAGLVNISEKTAYQPNKVDARVIGSEYDFVVVKE